MWQMPLGSATNCV